MTYLQQSVDLEVTVRAKVMHHRSSYFHIIAIGVATRSPFLNAPPFFTAFLTPLSVVVAP